MQNAVDCITNINSAGLLAALDAANVLEVDAAYDTTIAKLSRDEGDGGKDIVKHQVAQEFRGRSVSPELTKRPMLTSTPYTRGVLHWSPQRDGKARRSVSFTIEEWGVRRALEESREEMRMGRQNLRDLQVGTSSQF